jgi:hypothetical protein
MRRYLRRCMIGAFALVLAGLPVTVLGTPAISRADGECAPGWGWSVDLNQCVFLLPAANGPGGPGGTGWTRWAWGAGRARASRTALDARLAATTRRANCARSPVTTGSRRAGTIRTLRSLY